MSEVRSVLGFDFGLKRIGMATGQTITNTASPLTTLQSVNDKPDWDSIAQHIKQWKPDALIVGLPTMLDGSETEITRAAKKFSRELEQRFNLPVEGDDKVGGQHSREVVDHEADAVPTQRQTE